MIDKAQCERLGNQYYPNGNQTPGGALDMAIPTLTAFSPSFNGPEGQEDMPWLMTAGPVVTSREVKLAMLADWSVRDAEFVSMTLRVTEQLLQVLNAGDLYDCIPANFSGMAALESVLGALAPSGRKRQSLVAATGPGAAESAGILEYLRRPHQVLNVQTGKPVSVRGLQRALDANPDIATVLLAQLDVTTGLVSPVADLASAARAAGKSVVVDARHGAGALPLDLSAGHIDALVTVPWAALGSVPGFSTCSNCGTAFTGRGAFREHRPHRLSAPVRLHCASSTSRADRRCGLRGSGASTTGCWPACQNSAFNRRSTAARLPAGS
jgi:hypothetical protein